MSKLIAISKARPLKKGEVYYCHNGCGECQIIELKEDNLTVNNEVIEYSLVDASKCCHSLVGVWDTINDVEADDQEYVYKEINKPTAEIKLLWSLDSEHPSVFPERAMGHIFNDSEKRFEDGEEIMTSRILNYDTHREDGFLETRNTVYKIIK